MRLAPPFTDHAVLQRDLPIPVWGVAAANEMVRVRLGEVEAQVLAGADGSWLLRLPPRPAGGPFELVARAASGETRIVDVLVGEVWICSGQSNMQWPLGQTEQQVPPDSCRHPGIRLFTVGTPARLGRQTAIDGRWQSADAATLDRFSAVGGWFGRGLHRELGVPVGLICNAWGGTRVQAWMSREALMQDPLGQTEVQAYEAFAYGVARPEEGEFASFLEFETAMRSRDQGNAGLAQGWAGSACSEVDWATMDLPGNWQSAGHPGSGVFWFRRRLAVPPVWRGRDLVLELGAIDKHDDTYVNGERVGGLDWADGGNTWCTPRSYPVPGRLVQSELIIAVRARSHVYHGGMIGPAGAMRVHPAGDPAAAIPLTGTWRYRIEQDWGVQTPPGAAMGPGNPNAPFTLFDSRLAPLIPWGIRGVIWYQGESNAGEPEVYRRLLPQMIGDWRRAFAQGDFPFIQVQLANYMKPVLQPGASNWAALRDAQLATASTVPACGLAVAIDVGEAGDIHPRDKRTVGERLARWALVETYGRGGVPCGPVCAGWSIEPGGRMRIRFRHAAGLRTRDGGAPQQVAVCGADRAFVWAESAIEGDTLVAWHPRIDRIHALRYAWADNPEGCNLVNGDGLPASPFRTDSW